MTTNGEKFKTAQERAEAFCRFCNSFDDHCHGCPVADDCSMKDDAQGAFAWLDIEAEDEKPLPCPFCGGYVEIITKYIDDEQGHMTFVRCKNNLCGYRGCNGCAEDAVDSHNRVAKAVRESEAK